MGKIAFVFAGQGAQYSGMGQSLCEMSPAARAVFDVADTLRPGTSQQCFTAPVEELSITENTQPCLYCVDLAAAKALEEAGVWADVAAGFSLEQAIPLEEVLQHPDPASLLLGVDSYFSGRPSLVLTPQREKKVRNGMTIPFPDAPDGEYRVYSEGREFLALSRVSGGKLTTIKSFFEV